MKHLVEKNTGEPLSILLLEDDDGDAKAFLRAFEKAEITNPIIRVLDGVAAFEVLRGTNGKTKLRKPYVIISDINMPRMDGITFLQKLREDPELKKISRVYAHHFRCARRYLLILRFSYCRVHPQTPHHRRLFKHPQTHKCLLESRRITQINKSRGKSDRK